MDHGPTSLLATLVVTILLAFACGTVARLLRLPTLIGYLLAGVLVGPHTPGFAADVGLTSVMAEVGVALLLFGVGLHFRAADLLAVWRVAVPGALAQIAASTSLGALLGSTLLGLDGVGAAAFGLALAISSTAVATRTLEEQGRLSGQPGRIALGWLVMQDLVVVFALVLLPALAGTGSGQPLWPELLRAGLALTGFIVLMAVVGRRALPWAMARVARTGSRELFTLAVVAAALGVAFAASALFGVSFALGAFFAGVVLGESDVGHQAAAEATPMQRIFTAIFFLSVGMMLDPAALARQPFAAMASLLTVLLGVGGVIFLLLLVLRVPPEVAGTVAGAMGQVGEFSFLLASLAVHQGLVPHEVTGPILAAAFGSIVLTPVMLRVGMALGRRLEARPAMRRWRGEGGRAGRPVPHWPVLTEHAVVVGAGRVGSIVLGALRRHHLPMIVVEGDRRLAERLQADGIPVIWGDATRPEVLEAAAVKRARLMVLALPGALEAREVLRLAREMNPTITATVRTHTEDEAAFLEAEVGVQLVLMGEREIALGMADFAMQRLGVAPSTAQATVDVLRARRS